MVAARNVIFILRDGNVLYFAKEWHYGDFIPDTYFLYLPNLRAMRFSHTYSGRRFEHYERL